MSSTNRRRRSILKSSRNSIVNGLLDESANANFTANLTLPNKRVSFGHKQVKEFQFQLPVSNTDESPAPSPAFKKAQNNNGDMTMYSSSNMDVTFGHSANLNATYITGPATAASSRSNNNRDPCGEDHVNKTIRDEVMMDLSMNSDNGENEYHQDDRARSVVSPILGPRQVSGPRILEDASNFSNTTSTTKRYSIGNNKSIKEFDQMHTPSPAPKKTVKNTNNGDKTLYSSNMDVTFGNSAPHNATYGFAAFQNDQMDRVNKTIREEAMMNFSLNSEISEDGTADNYNNSTTTETPLPALPVKNRTPIPVIVASSPLPILTPRSMKTRSMANLMMNDHHQKPKRNLFLQDLPPSSSSTSGPGLIMKVPSPSQMRKVQTNPFRNKRVKKQALGCIFLSPKTPKRKPMDCIEVVEKPTTTCAETNTTPDTFLKQSQPQCSVQVQEHPPPRSFDKELINASCQTDRNSLEKRNNSVNAASSPPSSTSIAQLELSSRFVVEEEEIQQNNYQQIEQTPILEYEEEGHNNNNPNPADATFVSDTKDCLSPEAMSSNNLPPLSSSSRRFEEEMYNQSPIISKHKGHNNINNNPNAAAAATFVNDKDCLSPEPMSNNNLPPRSSSHRFEEEMFNQSPIIISKNNKAHNNYNPAADATFVNNASSSRCYEEETMRSSKHQQSTIFETTTTSHKADTTFVLENELSVRLASCRFDDDDDEILNHQLQQGPIFDTTNTENQSLEEEQDEENDDDENTPTTSHHNSNVTFVLDRDELLLSMRPSSSHSDQELLDNQQRPIFDSTADESVEDEPVEERQQQYQMMSSKVKEPAAAENPLPFSQNLYRYVTQSAEYDVGKRISEMTNITPEIIAMEDEDYINFKSTYTNCFLPYAWQSFEIHRRLMRRMGIPPGSAPSSD